MSLFELLFDRTRHDHGARNATPKPEPVCVIEVPCAETFVDKRTWFSDVTETITTEHQIEKGSKVLKYTATIFSQLTQSQFEEISQKIKVIHASESSVNVAHFYAAITGVLNGMDPSSIVIIATTSTDENTEVPIGYAYISGAPKSENALREIGVMVIPEYRKQGIAFQLFKDLLCHAAEFGITQVQINFRTANAPIWAFLGKASDPDHQLISFTKEVDGTETVAKISLVSCEEFANH